MIKNQISNKDIEFRQNEYSKSVLIHNAYLTAHAVLVDSRMKKSELSSTTSFILDTHQWRSREPLPEITKQRVISLNQWVNGWIAYIREEFYSVPQVETIYITIDQKDVDVWLIIPNRDIGIVRKLAEIEMNILQKLSTLDQPMFFFEFHVIYRCGVDERQLVPRHAFRLPR